MGDRDSGIRAGSQCDGDSRHDFERDAIGLQPLGLFGQSSKDQRIAAFEPHDRLALGCPPDQFLVDFRLGPDPFAAVASQADQFGIVADMPENLRIGQIVVQHTIGALQALDGAQRDQARIAWSGADKEDFSAERLLETRHIRIEQRRRLFCKAWKAGFPLGRIPA
jgi:hypothetical protein